MEIIFFLALYLLAIIFLAFGYSQKIFLPAFGGALMLLMVGGILYTEGFNSYVSCTGSTCGELTTLTLDSNQNITGITSNVVKQNATRNPFSKYVGLMSVTGGVFLAALALYQKTVS